MSGLEIVTEQMSDALYVYVTGYGRGSAAGMDFLVEPGRFRATPVIASRSDSTGLWQVNVMGELVRFYVNCFERLPAPGRP